ncbi:MAG TPA: hypothetical protein VN043_12855 [Rhodanobacter sp.]|nr:hypothetical protein [Rhodanobacter sp.]
MRAIHQLIGCALCIAGIGSASAANLDVPDLGNPTPHATSNTSSHDNSNSVDTPGSNRDVAPASSESAGSSSSNGNDRSTGVSPAPTSTQRTHLGWQSLLPGSIQ